MKLTWTFYPKGEVKSVTLTVVYVAEFDAKQLPTGGFLDADRNTAYVDWITYKRFDTADVAGRRDAYQRLTRITAEDQDISGILRFNLR